MWYVEYLLLHRIEIKTKADLESDEYNDLLVLEREIDKFTELKLISDKELFVLDLVIKSQSFLAVGNEINIGQKLVAEIFRNVCKRLSISLGDIFTDEGYLEHMQRKYNLTEEQVKQAERFMLSKFRHDIVSKPYKEN